MDDQGDKIESVDMKKCGDITTLLSVGKKEFFLNCGFCNYTFCQLDNFIQHITEEHMYQFTVPKLEEEVELPLDIEEALEDVDEQMQAEYATEEADESNSNLRNFERVEIEFDETAMSDSMDVKDPAFDDNMSDWNEETLNKSDTDSDPDFELPLAKAKQKAGNSNEEQDFAANIKLLGVAGTIDKDKLLAVFKSYEKRTVLWDAEVPRYSKSREKEMKDIATEVGLGKDFRTIQKLIGKLGARLRTEMIRKKIYASKGKTYTPLWYTDINTFIKQRKPIPTNQKPVKTIKTPKSLLTGEQCVVLAETYKQFPTLWNGKELTYYFSNRRREAAENLYETFLKKCDLKLTKKDVECEIARLRKICSCEKRRKVLCKRQNKAFRPTFKYYEHIKYLENDVTPYECLTCGILIAGSQQYKLHVAAHEGVLPFKCMICEHRFKCYNNFVVHLRRHAQDFMYSCEVCNKQLATASELKIHVRLHTGERPFICEVCGNKYKSNADLKLHMTCHDPVARFPCEICSKSFRKKKRLTEHMTVHTQIRNKICHLCDKGFTLSKHLRQHMLIHAEEKKYCCKICGKRFAQPAGLSVHVRSHGTTQAEISSKTVTCEPIYDDFDDDEDDENEQKTVTCENITAKY